MGARGDSGHSLWSCIGVGVIRFYSRCAEVGHAELDPSVGFGHVVPSVGMPSGQIQMHANADGQVWRHLET